MTSPWPFQAAKQGGAWALGRCQELFWREVALPLPQGGNGSLLLWPLWAKGAGSRAATPGLLDSRPAARGLLNGGGVAEASTQKLLCPSACGWLTLGVGSLGLVTTLSAGNREWVGDGG